MTSRMWFSLLSGGEGDGRSWSPASFCSPGLISKQQAKWQVQRRCGWPERQPYCKPMGLAILADSAPQFSILNSRKGSCTWSALASSNLFRTSTLRPANNDHSVTRLPKTRDPKSHDSQLIEMAPIKKKVRLTSCHGPCCKSSRPASWLGRHSRSGLTHLTLRRQRRVTPSTPVLPSS